MIRISRKNIQYLLSSKNKLIIFALHFFVILHSNSFANDINIPHDWYRYQGAPDASVPSHDCGPACVAMIISFIKGEYVPISAIRDYIAHRDGTGAPEISGCLDHWGISCEWKINNTGNIINAINNHGHILVCGVSMNYINKGQDIDGKSDDPSLCYDRYSSYSGYHWIVIKGVSNDNQCAIVYDPNVFGSYPNPKFWYSNGNPKGKNRYYNLSELNKAIMVILEINGGPGDSISRKFTHNSNIRIFDDSGLILRSNPRYESLIINILPKGMTGRVVSDSRNGKYSDGFYWWHVRFGDFEGWCIEDHLESIQLSSTNYLNISGTVKYNSDDVFALDGLDVIAIDELRRFYIKSATRENEHGKYSMILANEEGVPSATEGYYIRVIVKDDGYILGTQTHILTRDDIIDKNVIIDVVIGDSEIPEDLDINKDGVLSNSDLIQFGMNFAKTGYDLPEDVNNDGKVDLTDLVRLSEFLYGDIPNPSIDNCFLIERIQDTLIKALDPSNNLRVLISKLDSILNYTRTELFPCYPNPCNPGTWIPFKLAEQAEVKIFIHDVIGRTIRIFGLGNLPEGRYTVEGRAVYWDGCNDYGEKVSNGIYFYTLIAGSYKKSGRLIVLK